MASKNLPAGHGPLTDLPLFRGAFWAPLKSGRTATGPCPADLVAAAEAGASQQLQVKLLQQVSECV